MSKNFKDAIRQTEKAPALDFISTAPQSEPEPEKAPEPVAHEARLSFDLPEVERPEIRNRKFMLLLKPSTFKALKAKATQRGESVNSLVNRLVEAYIND